MQGGNQSKKTMSRRHAIEAAENAKKWNDAAPPGLTAAPGTLAALAVTTDRCPLQRVRVACYVLECGHNVSRDAAHEMLEDTAHANRPAIKCPTCNVSAKICTQCIACDGWRPFTWGCRGCLAPHCATCIASNECEVCAEPFA